MFSKAFLIEMAFPCFFKKRAYLRLVVLYVELHLELLLVVAHFRLAKILHTSSENINPYTNILHNI
jgi:hypothetical protein